MWYIQPLICDCYTAWAEVILKNVVHPTYSGFGVVEGGVEVILKSEVHPTGLNNLKVGYVVEVTLKSMQLPKHVRSIKRVKKVFLKANVLYVNQFKV